MGHCYWAKGELTEARGCFLQSIEQSENAEAFRHLSMICRQIQEKNSGMTSGLLLLLLFSCTCSVDLDVNDNSNNNNHHSFYNSRVVDLFSK